MTALASRARTRPPVRVQAVLVGVRALVLALVVALATACGAGSAPKKSGASPTPHPTAGAATSASAPRQQGSAPAPDPGYQAPVVGSCHAMGWAESVASVATSRSVRCKGPHTSVVAYVGYVRRPVTPTTPLEQRRKLAAKVCEPAFRHVVGGTSLDRASSVLTWAFFTPGQAELVRGARWVRCDVVARSGTELIGLPSTEPLLKGGLPEGLRICEDRSGADVSCARPHAYRVAAVFSALGRAFPGAAFTVSARARCRQLTKTFGGFWQPPSREGWAAGDRTIRCLVPSP